MTDDELRELQRASDRRTQRMLNVTAAIAALRAIALTVLFSAVVIVFVVGLVNILSPIRCTT